VQLRAIYKRQFGGTTMQECAVKEVKSLTWAAPAYCDVRLGFEVTAYIYVR
jgi:pyrroloquinoline quinone biosynthesis protein A